MSLRIKDIQSLKITKIKEFYSVYFKIDGQTYLLHESSEGYESSTDLFRKDNDEVGRYKLTFIKSSLSSISTILPRRKNNMPYSQINPYEFIFNMKKAGLVSTNDNAIKLISKYHDKMKEVNKLAKEIEHKTR